MKFLAYAMIAASLVASPALASPAFDSFRQVCGDTHADFTAIKIALSGAAWTPTDAAPMTMEGVTVTESVARQANFGGEKVTVDAWTGMRGAFHVTACTVRAPKNAAGAADKDSQAWLGFAPQAKDGGKLTWRFGDDGAKLAALDPSGYQAAVGKGGLYFYNLSTEQSDAVLDLLKIQS